MKNQFSPKYVIIALSVVVLVLAGILVWQSRQEPLSFPEENFPSNEGGQIVHKPWAETAERYYPGGGNAIDFRNGAQGDFEIEASMAGNTVELSWPEEIKVVEVKVYDVGTLRDLQDHAVIFNIINWDVNSPPELTDEIATSTPSGPLPQPEVYLSPDYEVGDRPAGFFNGFFVEPEPKENLFEKGKRYSIELMGVNGAGELLMGYYTFNYEE
jgi:hypothetical protein